MTVSDADRAKAADLLFRSGADNYAVAVDYVAAALAAERAAAVADLRARVEALVEELELDGHRFACVPDPYATGLGDARINAAARLRAAITDTTGDPA